MNTKTNVNILISSFLKKFDDDLLRKENNEKLDEMLTSVVNKYNFIEHLVDSIVIRLVINRSENISKDFNAKDILYIYEIHNIILLKKIFAMQTKKYEDKEITACFIVDNEINVDQHRILDYALSSLRQESNRENNHINFENSLKENKSYYAKNAKLSLLNTFFSNNLKRVFRLNENNKFTSLENIRSTIPHKYAKVACPICADKYESLSDLEKENYRLHIFEITENTIDEIIHVEKNIKRVSFNCIHEDMNVESPKFFIEAQKYNVDLHKEDKRKVQEWFLKNFKYFAKVELNETS